MLSLSQSKTFTMIQEIYLVILEFWQSILAFEENNAGPKDLSVKTKIGNAEATITFPHIEDPQFNINGEYTRIMVQDYLKLFGYIWGSQSHILSQLEEYIPSIDWKNKLGKIYKP